MCSMVTRSQESAAKTLSLTVAIFGNHSKSFKLFGEKWKSYFYPRNYFKKCRNNKVVIRDNLNGYNNQVKWLKEST